MADKTPEYGAVSMAGLVTPGGHLSFSTGIEVQFKKNPGFGYKVIDVVKNEHALRALDGSSMAIGLFHELEEYCDLEKASFIKKASAVIWEADAATVHLSHSDADKAREALKEVTERLFDAGARFPDTARTPFSALTDDEIYHGVTRVAIRLLPEKYKNLYAAVIYEQWAKGTYPCEDACIKAFDIYDAITGRDSREVVLERHPELEDI